MMKLIVTFCNFANVSKNVTYPWISLIIVLFMPHVFLKTSFHSGRIKNMYVCVCILQSVCHREMVYTPIMDSNFRVIVG